MKQNGANLYQSKTGVKHLIVKAYIELLTEKTYSDITVSEIVKRAEVARVSFYRSFGSIDAIIDEIINGFYARVTKK